MDLCAHGLVRGDVHEDTYRPMYRKVQNHDASGRRSGTEGRLTPVLARAGACHRDVTSRTTTDVISDGSERERHQIHVVHHAVGEITWWMNASEAD